MQICIHRPPHHTLPLTMCKLQTRPHHELVYKTLQNVLKWSKDARIAMFYSTTHSTIWSVIHTQSENASEKIVKSKYFINMNKMWFIYIYKNDLNLGVELEVEFLNYFFQYISGGQQKTNYFIITKNYCKKQQKKSSIWHTLKCTSSLHYQD